jgi:hypothetical protein
LLPVGTPLGFSDGKMLGCRDGTLDGEYNGLSVNSLIPEGVLDCPIVGVGRAEELIFIVGALLNDCILLGEVDGILVGVVVGLPDAAKLAVADGASVWMTDGGLLGEAETDGGLLIGAEGVSGIAAVGDAEGTKVGVAGVLSVGAEEGNPARPAVGAAVCTTVGNQVGIVGLPVGSAWKPEGDSVGVFEGTDRLGNNEGESVVVFEGTSDGSTESEKLGNSVEEDKSVGTTVGVPAGSVGTTVGTAVGIADPVEPSVGVTVTIGSAVGTLLGTSVGVAVAPASGIPAGCPVCTAVGNIVVTG